MSHPLIDATLEAQELVIEPTPPVLCEIDIDFRHIDCPSLEDHPAYGIGLWSCGCTIAYCKPAYDSAIAHGAIERSHQIGLHCVKCGADPIHLVDMQPLSL